MRVPGGTARRFNEIDTLRTPPPHFSHSAFAATLASATALGRKILCPQAGYKEHDILMSKEKSATTENQRKKECADVRLCGERKKGASAECMGCA
jgi:hypothetical protein